MNLNDIDYLVAVAEHRHVGRAAETLGLTQSALTRALARLESLAGLPLFERHPKGVIPTEAGLAFLRRARRIQLEYDDTLSELHQMKTGELGILRGHAPLMALLGSGDLRVRQGGATEHFHVEGGFLQVVDNVVTVLSERAEAAG